MTELHVIYPGMNASIAMIGLWCLGATAGWLVGATAYYLNMSDWWVWSHLNKTRRCALCLLGALIAVFGLPLLPASLPSAYTAWFWHTARRSRKEKMMVLIRAIESLRTRSNQLPAA